MGRRNERRLWVDNAASSGLLAPGVDTSLYRRARCGFRALREVVDEQVIDCRCRDGGRGSGPGHCPGRAVPRVDVDRCAGRVGAGQGAGRLAGGHRVGVRYPGAWRVRCRDAARFRPGGDYRGRAAQARPIASGCAEHQSAHSRQHPAGYQAPCTGGDAAGGVEPGRCADLSGLVPQWAGARQGVRAGRGAGYRAHEVFHC